MLELNGQSPGGFWVHVNEQSLIGGANFTTLMKRFASSGPSPSFTALRAVISGSITIFTF